MIRILHGDCREVLTTLDEESVHCVVTSPPYYNLRNYEVIGQIGLEASPDAYVAELVDVFREVWRVLRSDGIVMLNIGDGYSNGGRKTRGHDDKLPARTMGFRADDGAKPKDLLMIPSRVAMALQGEGWWLRSQMPWLKRAVMPESVGDRPNSAVEYVFMLSKRPKYFWDATAVARKGAIPAGTRAAKGGNVRSELKDVNGRPPEYWNYTGTRNFRNSDLFFDSLTPPHGLICDGEGLPIAIDVNPGSFDGAHFAAFPPALVEPLIKGSTSERGCCPECGAPWFRQTERPVSFTSGSGRAGNVPAGKYAGTAQAESGSYDIRMGPAVQTSTTGWSQSCDCPPSDPVPCTVLDPFSGAGTTALVADRLQRDAIGIELNGEYVAMARNRISNDAGLFAEVV